MIASIANGKIQGVEKDGVVQFRGIRYAAAERFRPPRPVDPWDDVYDATVFGAPAPQNPSPLESMLSAPAVDGSEDCLFLNVYTPAVDDRARPVMSSCNVRRIASPNVTLSPSSEGLGGSAMGART